MSARDYMKGEHSANAAVP